METASKSQDIIQNLRGRIINSIRILTVYFGSVLMLLTVYLDWQNEEYVPMVALLLLFGTLLYVLYSRNFSVRSRSLTLVTVVYFIAINAFFESGVLGGGRFWLIVTSSLAGALLGRKAAYISFAICILTVMAVNISHQFGFFPGYPPAPDSWMFVLDAGLDVTLMTFLTVIPATLLFSALKKVFVRERELRIASKQLNNQILDSHKSIRTLNDTIANDLNPILRMAKFNTLMMKENLPTDDGTQAQEYVAKLEENMDHIDILINDSQRLSSIYNSTIDKCNVKLQTVLSETANRLGSSESGTIKIVCQEEAEVFADPHLLKIFIREILISTIYYRDSEKDIELTAVVEQQNSVTMLMFTTNELFQEKKELEGQKDNFIPFYNPFIPKGSSTNGTKLLVAQQAIYLQGGAFTRFAVEEGRFHFDIILPQEEE
jgi:hypothetical protein